MMQIMWLVAIWCKSIDWLLCDQNIEFKYRSSRSQIFCKIGVLKKFAKFRKKQQYRSPFFQNCEHSLVVFLWTLQNTVLRSCPYNCFCKSLALLTATVTAKEAKKLWDELQDLTAFYVFDILRIYKYMYNPIKHLDEAFLQK